MPEEGGAKQRNPVHEMEVWKQRCASELITQKNWDATWGFLKTPRRPDEDEHGKAGSYDKFMLRKVFEKFDVNKDGTMSVLEFSQMLKSATKEEQPEKALCKFFCKMDEDANFVIDINEFFRMAKALKAGKLPGLGPLDLVTMKRPSPSEMLEQSSGDMPKSIQKMLNGGDEKKPDDADEVPTRFKHRLAKLKPPKERFSHPVTTQQELGWHKSVEGIFGKGPHGRKRNQELWAEKNPDQHRF